MLGLADRPISESLMGAIGVEKSSVLLPNVIEMPQAETHEMIQALPLECSDPRFGEGIGIRRQEQG